MTTLEGENSKLIVHALWTAAKGIDFHSIDDDTIIAHLPFHGSKVKCDNGFEQDIVHSFDIGALRLILGCGCKIVIRSRVIARSHRMVCDVRTDHIKIEKVVPIQMSLVHGDWVPHQSGVMLETKYTSRDVYSFSILSRERESSELYLEFGVAMEMLCNAINAGLAGLGRRGRMRHNNNRNAVMSSFDTVVVDHHYWVYESS
jgi:hypothetical protein